MQNSVGKPAPKSKPKPDVKENVVDIRKFIQVKQTESKRKICSPLQTSNPMPHKVNKLKTPQKLTERVSNDFSLGMSLLCDQLESSTLEENPESSENLESPIIERKMVPSKLALTPFFRTDRLLCHKIW